MGGPRQHTVPNFYLKEFLNSGIVYRRGAKSPRFVKKPKNVAVRINYYGESSGNLDILDQMNSAIEGWAAPVLKRLVYDVTSITYSDWVTLPIILRIFMSGHQLSKMAWLPHLKNLLRR
jgi:hypothetical protein